MLHIVKRLPLRVQRVLLLVSVLGLAVGLFVLLQ